MCRRRLAPGPFLDPSDKLRIALLRGNPGTARPTGPGGVGLPQQQEAAQRQRRGSKRQQRPPASWGATASISTALKRLELATGGAACRGGFSTYYEVELLGPLPKYPQLGWTAEGWFETTSGPTNEGVGDLPGSWGVDGQRLVKFGARGATGGGTSGGVRQAAGDIIGFACCVRGELDTAGAVVGHRGGFVRGV